MSKAYLAHAHEDNVFADRLAEDLQRAGVSLWYDKERLDLGSDIVQRMNEGLENYDFFLVVWSRQAKKSGWVEREIDVALTRQIQEKRRLIPLLLDDTPLPPLLRPLRHIDFRGGYEEQLIELKRILLEQLVEGIKSVGSISAHPSGNVALSGFEERVESRIAMFRLREALWTTIRKVMLHWRGGFAGISLANVPSLLGYLRGHDLFVGPDGEVRFQALSDFEELCHQAFANQLVAGEPVLAACAGASNVLQDLQRWLSEHPRPV